MGGRWEGVREDELEGMRGMRVGRKGGRDYGWEVWIGAGHGALEWEGFARGEGAGRAL